MSLFVMVVEGGLKLSKGFLHLRPNRVLTIGVKRLRGKFYCDPTVGAKCFYQNPKPWHNRVDMAEWIPNFTH